jgi:glycosyltransferase involved in cell wall biosynthesis
MKILFVIDTLGSGGKERRMLELLRALNKRSDIAMELVIMSHDIHYYHIYDLGINIHRIVRGRSKDISVFRKFRQLIRELKPDVVHCWESMTAVYLAPVCWLLKCPLINGMITNVPQSPRILNHHWRRGRLTFPFSTFIISNSKAGLTAYSVPKKKGRVIYNGFDFLRLDNLDNKEKIKRELNITTQYVVGMVASFCKQKDYPTFFSAARILLKERYDITFLAIGAYTDSEESAGLLDDELKKYFRLLGIRTDVESIINIMDIGVLATFTEGISNSIMEYMALEKPVVASEGGGTVELMIEGVTGYLLKPGDSNMLAERINELLNNAELREKMGLNGRKQIEKNFSIDRMAEEYLKIYRQVCNS